MQGRLHGKAGHRSIEDGTGGKESRTKPSYRDLFGVFPGRSDGGASEVSVRKDPRRCCASRRGRLSDSQIEACWARALGR